MNEEQMKIQEEIENTTLNETKSGTQKKKSLFADRKKLIIVCGVIGVIVVAVIVGIFSSKVNEDKSGVTSGKKELLQKYSGLSPKYELENYEEYGGYSFYLTDAENEKLMCLYKAAIDYAMENTSYDGRDNIVGYFVGVHKAVMRLQKLDKYQDDIEIVEDNGERFYKLSSSVISDIGKAMWNMDIPKWTKECEELDIVTYDVSKDVYYFSIEEPVDYYLESLYEVSQETVTDTTAEYAGSICATMTLSKKYVSGYSIKGVQLDVSSTDANSFAITINDVSEYNLDREPSLLQYNSNNPVSRMNILANSTIAMECFIVPYAYYREETETEKEAAWRSIYFGINKLIEYKETYLSIYGVSDFSHLSSFSEDMKSSDIDNDGIIQNTYIDLPAMIEGREIERIYGMYGLEKIYDEETKKNYIQISEVFVDDLMHAYTGKRNVKISDIPSELKDLFVYDEEHGYYKIELDSEKYNDIYMEIEYEAADYDYSEYCSVYVTKYDDDGEIDNIINMFMTYSNSNNLNFEISYVNFS